MIQGFIGRPSSGKTYTMTGRALDVWERYETIYANYTLRLPNVVKIEPDDLLHIEGASRGSGGKKVLVLTDEVHLWFPARLSMKLPPSMMMQFSQTGKAGWDWWYSSQHEKRVDTVIRDVSNWMWLCNAWGVPWSETPKLFTAKCWEPELFRKKDKHYTRTIRRFSREVAEAYDTSERLDVASHVLEVKDHYRKRPA